MNNLLQKHKMNEFTLDEAVLLIYKLVVLKSEKEKSSTSPSITELGHICGVLTLNDQIEIVIKFHDALRQFTKQEFISEIQLHNQKY